jgi:hypothetical protein
VEGETWWFPAMPDAEFGKTTASLRQHGEPILDLSSNGEIDTVWVPYTPSTYPEWWSQFDAKYHISELFQNDEQDNEESLHAGTRPAK